MKNQHLMPMIIWGAFFMTNIILALVLHNTQLEGGSENLSNLNISVFYIVALGSAVLGFFIPRMFLRNAARTSEQQKNPFFTAFVIRMTFFEMIGVLGFVVAMSLKSMEDFYPFMLTSMILMILTFPTTQKQQDRRL